ncbi:hypothetical protein L3X38_010535 [Prunus dulcis]|uniref:Retrovirus-related Pol polyprotein from transposon TNT 1-94-like beta-barrel domain-containing protein n=1 Tax=Prunus dulcis TaxID=3755 RepID=A0AAD4WG06_PRUDU|nr:hypothetical protein L3X38_010535 [Prunus dulcis]
MSKPPTIHSFLADSLTHAVTPTELATRARASMSTTKGSAFHKSSLKPTWIIDSGATNHMKFDPSQLISSKSTTSSVASNANSTTSSMVRDGSISLSKSIHLESALLVLSLDHNLLTSSRGRRVVVVLGEANSTTWTGHRIMRPSFDVFNFQCDTCELAKSHCVPFPLSTNKSLVPFILIHSDVWGPAQIATPAEAR